MAKTKLREQLEYMGLASLEDVRSVEVTGSNVTLTVKRKRQAERLANALNQLLAVRDSQNESLRAKPPS